MTIVNNVLKNAKAYVALAGSIATALLGVFAANTPVGQVLTAVVVLATAFGTWRVPNATQPPGSIPAVPPAPEVPAAPQPPAA